MRRRPFFVWFQEERGVALVTGLLVSMVVLSVALVAVGVAQHNVNQSSRDRKRVQGIDAAEAGLNAFFSLLRTTSNSEMPCPSQAGDPNIAADLPTSPSAHYDVFASFYSTWPPSSGSELTCQAVQSGVRPEAAMVRSVGTAVATASPTSVVRTMESTVRLEPRFGGLNQAIFSDAELNIQNRLTVNGNGSNNGDVYTNGDFVLTNNTVIGGSAYAQGAATIGQGIVRADVWANNAVALSNGIEVFGRATSSVSTIALDNATVHQDAKAGQTITLSNNSQVLGNRVENSESGPPPSLEFPRYCWPNCPGDPPDSTMLAYTTAPPDLRYNPSGVVYQLVSFGDCASAKTFIDTMPVGNYVVRITSTCPLTWGNNARVSIRGHLAIWMDGSFNTVNQTRWDSVGGQFNLLIIRGWEEGLDCSTGQYDINVSNRTEFNNLTIFAYTPCTIRFGNNNSGGVNGQLIGGTVSITNNMVLNFVPILAPMWNLLGYDTGVSYMREIANQP